MGDEEDERGDLRGDSYERKGLCAFCGVENFEGEAEEVEEDCCGCRGEEEADEEEPPNRDFRAVWLPSPPFPRDTGEKHAFFANRSFEFGDGDEISQSLRLTLFVRCTL